MMFSHIPTIISCMPLSISLFSAYLDRRRAAADVAHPVLTPVPVFHSLRNGRAPLLRLLLDILTAPTAEPVGAEGVGRYVRETVVGRGPG